LPPKTKNTHPAKKWSLCQVGVKIYTIKLLFNYYRFWISAFVHTLYSVWRLPQASYIQMHPISFGKIATNHNKLQTAPNTVARVLHYGKAWSLLWQV